MTTPQQPIAEWEKDLQVLVDKNLWQETGMSDFDIFVLKSFITKLLQAQKEELAGKVEGKLIIDKPHEDLYGQWDLGYSAALQDILALLKE